MEFFKTPPIISHAGHRRDYLSLAQELDSRPGEWAKIGSSSITRGNRISDCWKAALGKAGYEMYGRGGYVYARSTDKSDSSGLTSGPLKFEVEWVDGLPGREPAGYSTLIDAPVSEVIDALKDNPGLWGEVITVPSDREDPRYKGAVSLRSMLRKRDAEAVIRRHPSNGSYTLYARWRDAH